METIDTRDLIAQAEELEAEDELSQEAQEQLDEIDEIRATVPGYEQGATLIPEDDFQEYAQELAEDIGAIESVNDWPACHIDWTEATAALKQDYIEVSYQGVEYLVRG